jgi:antitoxin StbD
MADVVTTGEAREALHRIARQFDAGEGDPVYFGSHRRAQAVIVPVEVWEQLLEAAEDDLDTKLADRRVSAGPHRRSTRSDLDEAFKQAREAARRPA